MPTVTRLEGGNSMSRIALLCITLGVAGACMAQTARQIGVDELSLMTLPELATTAYTECSERARAVGGALSDINAGDVFRQSLAGFHEAGLHEENAKRI